MEEETMKILRDRIGYIEMHPEKLVIIGKAKQMKSPMFNEKQWTKILTTKAKGK